MENEEMVLANEFCIQHDIELSFIYAVNESGLIEVSVNEEQLFVPASQLHYLEKLVRLHFDLNINLEGIETVSYLLQKMNNMQEKILMLSNRLRVY
ncbi:MAG: MerR family transcriptional regulator, partial [Opitutaceae bacterium]|nr:MerR family transcriptional regulator [Cytophagales bacterium]